MKKNILDPFRVIQKIGNRNGVWPLIEDETVFFIYEGHQTTVSVIGDFNDWKDPWTLERLEGTDFWVYSVQFERSARFDYKYILNGEYWVLDPRNPLHSKGGWGENSELRMPDYREPDFTTPQPDGSFQIDSYFPSNILLKNYPLRIDLPHMQAKLPPSGCTLLLFLDGHEYLSYAQAPSLLQSLRRDGLLDFYLAVYISPQNRYEEYVGESRSLYRRFLLEELLPYLEGVFNIGKHRIIIGDSFAGNFAFYVMRCPDNPFTGAVLQSPAFWPFNYRCVRETFLSTPISRRLSIAYGTYDHLLSSFREWVREHLENEGWNFSIVEYPQGHNWGLWKSCLQEQLKHLIKTDCNPVKGL